MEQQHSQQPMMVASDQYQDRYSMAPGQMQAPPLEQFSAIAGQLSVGYPENEASIPPCMGPHFIHQQQVQHFWTTQMQEIERVNDFKYHHLPLARIKKIMKADEDVRMISAEAPVLFSKACEMFILELTLRSWIHTEEYKRRTLHKNDIAAAITHTEIFDFLVDVVPRDELKDEGLSVSRIGLPLGAPAETIPHEGIYYTPPAQAAAPTAAVPHVSQSAIASPAMIVGRPAMQVDPAYISQQRLNMPYVSQQVWQQQLFPETSAGDSPTS